MRHFVAYHSAEKMGGNYESGAEYAFLSRKGLAALEKTVGESVWIINGAKRPQKTIYSLCAVFTPDQVIDLRDSIANYVVTGQIGYDFDEPVILNNLPWFSDFLKAQANFSLGINEIQDAAIQKHLTALAAGINLKEMMSSENSQLPEDLDTLDMEYMEGAAKYVTHLRRERNPNAVESKKDAVLTETGKLACEVCDIDFESVYGSLGTRYCEVHHRLPLASIATERVTKLSDLAVVCSNCHRMIHRSNPMYSIAELKQLVLTGRGGV
jgi:HNH endonuclease